MSGSQRLAPATLLLVLGSGVLLTATRLATPEDLMCADQERPASYVLDVLRNGHWICQTDWTGDVTSKPPMYTWMAAAVALPFGRLNRLLLLAPSIGAVLVLSWLILRTGSFRFGSAAGLLGALAFLLSPITAWLVAVARTDNLFALAVTVTALLAFRAWTTGRGWLWFWLAAAAATLTKGPLGLLLGAMGLGAACWEKHDGRPLPLRGSQVPGILLYLAITVGWLAWSWAEMGRGVMARMIGEELIGSVHTGGSGPLSVKHFFVPVLYVLGRFAPWSLLSFVGLWRIAKHPAKDHEERRFERFLFCWLVGGIAVFSIPAHQRVALLFPLMPPAAWLAGREMARLAEGLRPAVLLRFAAIGALCILGLIAFYYQRFRGDERQIAQTAVMKDMARQIQAHGAASLPIVHVDTPFALQYFLGTMNPAVTPEQAARLLAGSNTVFVALCDLPKVESLLPADHPEIFHLLHSPANGVPQVMLLSNGPRLESAPAMATGFGGIRVQWDRMALEERRGDRYDFRATGTAAMAQFSNDSERPRPIRVRLQHPDRTRVIAHTLTPHEIWRIRAGEPAPGEGQGG